MSNLSYLEELLGGIEVEWKALGKIAEYSTIRVDADELDAKSFVGVDNLVTDKGGRVDAIYLPNTARVTAYRPGDVLIGNIRPYLKKIWKATSSGGCSGDVLAVRILDKFKSVVDSEFLYYLLSSDKFFTYNMQNAKGAKMPRGDKAAILNYKIPIPCPDNPKKSLEIQAEIVRILDAFTELTSELTSELTAREKQYNYYRDQLLSFEERGVEWKPLKQVANIKNGKDWKNLGAGDIPVYGSGGVMQHVDTFAYDKPTVLIPRKGSITNIFYVETPFWNVDTIYYTEIDADKIIPKFFYYFMKTVDLMLLDTGSGRPSLTQAILNEIKVPVPVLAEQARIVAILDKFDTLTSSISEGLPREITLRNQQYEYYRDLLLSFPKTEEVST